MKITIDTKEDSEQEIRKAIRLLISLVGGNVYSNDSDFSQPEKSKNIFEDDSEPVSNLMGMFDSDSKQDSEQDSDKDQAQTVELY
ncbi:hypothetical protein DRJ22_05085 [Candidatus Woesearchaeota archaeon]|nr:MAG: hypothetical protein DRJ22_05085 [Candidatus Woesearchaeota archaeon]